MTLEQLPGAPVTSQGQGGEGRHSPGGGLASWGGRTAPRRPQPRGQSQRRLPRCLRLLSRKIPTPRLRPSNIVSGRLLPTLSLN